METMEAKNKEALDENQSATDRLQLSFEELRTDMEKSVHTFTIRTIVAIGLLGVFIAILHFYK
ncbi:MAG: hypothetical protein OXF19_04545 [Hyphomicrobiales bacterium]|nr:hypothetical protein [Hyphomicrobiales bacterium]